MSRRSKEFIKHLCAALHSSVPSVLIDGNLYVFMTNSNNCRYVVIDDVKYIQQNPVANTLYGYMAREEKAKITWGIRPGKWDLIVNNKILVFEGKKCD